MSTMRATQAPSIALAASVTRSHSRMTKWAMGRFPRASPSGHLPDALGPSLAGGEFIGEIADRGGEGRLVHLRDNDPLRPHLVERDAVIGHHLRADLRL